VYAPKRLADPADVLTSTSIVPGTPDGVETTMAVAVAETTVAGFPPKVTDVGPANSVPFSVTLEPPALVPTVALSEVNVGGAGATYVYAPDFVVVPSGLTTVTSTDPVVDP